MLNSIFAIRWMTSAIPSENIDAINRIPVVVSIPAKESPSLSPPKKLIAARRKNMPEIVRYICVSIGVLAFSLLIFSY